MILQAWVNLLNNCMGINIIVDLEDWRHTFGTAQTVRVWVISLTYKIRQAVPDGFSDSCKECFGQKGGIEWIFENIPKVDDSTAPGN